MSEPRHLRALQAFDAAATHASLTRAAEVLGVTHGAVSRQIRQLELALGIRLLERLPHGVETTQEGARLHLATRQAFMALREGLRALGRRHDGRSVTISLATSLAIKWLVPRLPSFRARHPGIAVFLDTNDAVIDLAASDVDVALRYGVPAWDGLHVERLQAEDLIVVAAPSLVADTALPMAPEAIAALPRLDDRFTPAWDDWAEGAGLAHPHPAAAKMAFQDSAVLIAAAIDGQGVALARRLLAADDLAQGRLVRLDRTAVNLDRALYFVCRKGDEDRPVIRSLRRWLLSLSEAAA